MNLVRQNVFACKIRDGGGGKNDILSIEAPSVQGKGKKLFFFLKEIIVMRGNLSFAHEGGENQKK